jgi:hypothetical protein
VRSKKVKMGEVMEHEKAKEKQLKAWSLGSVSSH